MEEGFQDAQGINEVTAMESDGDPTVEARPGEDGEEDEQAIHLEEDNLLEHVEMLLNRGDNFVSIAQSLGLSRKVLSRRLYCLGWEGVYHTLTLEECRDAISSVVPLDRAGCNWGIRTVQALLRRELKLRVPRQLVRDALHTMQPGHMRRREVRLLFRGQYNVTEPMVLWHMDCKSSIQLIHFTD